MDTQPILGRGAVEDTHNLLASGIWQLCQALALAQAPTERAAGWAQRHDLGRYFAGSLKGPADLDWSDPATRKAFLTEIVTDARRLLRLTGTLLPTLLRKAQTAVREEA